MFGLALAGCGSPSTGGDMSVGDMAMSSSAPNCTDYCTKIAANCTAGSGDSGSNAQYPDSATCLKTCSMSSMWASGMTGDTSGDTLGCRIYHAGAAASNPVLHCPHAGPTGGNTCGTWCANYCDLMAKNCTGTNAVYDTTTCMTKCMTIPTTGHVNDQSGDSIQCRIWHLGKAFDDAVKHCPHAKTKADNPTGPCT